MKRIGLVLVSLILSMVLMACVPQETETEPVHLSILVPVGTPALAQAYYHSTMPRLEDDVTYDIHTVFGTDPLVAAFGSGSHDIIYAPTNLGAKLISTGVDYQFAATVVLGNLYLVSTGYETFSLADLDGKHIIAFGQNSTPDVILRTAIASHSFEVEPTIAYVESVSEAQSALLLDPTNIILIAEPALSVLGLPSNLGDELDIIDLQSVWESVTGEESYPQAGIFVKSDIDSRALNLYLEQIQHSVEEANGDPSGIAAMAVDLQYGFPEAVLTMAIPRANLTFQTAQESRESLETFFTYIMSLDPSLIGGALPDDSFYYEGESDE